MRYMIFGFTCWLLIGCGSISKDDDMTQQVATAWADAYFNCDYHEAEEYTTEESRKWLQFAASNTTEKDLELLRERPATVEADDYFTQANDTLRVVTLTVCNYLKATNIDEAPQQSDEGIFLITVVKRDGDWKVRMEGLPRSEKQSHD